MTPLLRCDPRMGATTVSLMDGHIWIWAGKYTVGIRTRVRTAVGPLFEMLHIYMVWLGFAKTHTYPVWGMTTLRQFRSSGPMRAPCSRGLSLGLLVPNVYWVLFFFVTAHEMLIPLRPLRMSKSYRRLRKRTLRLESVKALLEMSVPTVSPSSET